tara:strand:+ start:359 stop:1357 length:999 start_codon:yes stop_codon:yes gene_type:complete
MSLVAHCYLNKNTDQTHQYWIQHFFQEGVVKLYVHNATPEMSTWLSAQTKLNTTVLSAFAEEDPNETNELARRIRSQNESLGMARTEGFHWLLFMKDNEILDVRTQTTLSSVLDGLPNIMSNVFLKIFEVVKTYEEDRYNYFVNEENAFRNAESFLDLRNRKTDQNGKLDNGNVLIVNVRCPSLIMIGENKMSINPNDMKTYNKNFNIESRAWRILSYSMCNYDSWKKNERFEKDTSEEDKKFLYDTTVYCDEESVQRLKDKNEIFIIDEAQMMTITPSKQEPPSPPPPPPPSQDTPTDPLHSSMSKKELIDLALPLCRTVLDALEFYKKNG